MPVIEEALGIDMPKKNQLDTPLSDHRKFKQYAGRYGVEIELEGRGLSDHAIPGWSLKADGSLREGGVEFVLQQPMNEQSLRGALLELQTTLSRPGVEVRLSPRASTHIHLNVQKETIRTILYMMCLFTIVDPLVCRLAGDARDGNLFCLPTMDSGNVADTIRRMTSLAVEGMIGAFPQRGKYSSVNMNPLQTFGSLEFRMFPPTVTPGDVMAWVSWLSAVLSLARSCKEDRALLTQINLARSNPQEMIKAVFGAIKLPDLESSHLIQLGCETAYEVYRAIKNGQNATEVKKANVAALRGEF